MSHVDIAIDGAVCGGDPLGEGRHPNVCLNASSPLLSPGPEPWP